MKDHSSAVFFLVRDPSSAVAQLGRRRFVELIDLLIALRDQPYETRLRLAEDLCRAHGVTSTASPSTLPRRETWLKRGVSMPGTISRQAHRITDSELKNEWQSTLEKLKVEPSKTVADDVNAQNVRTDVPPADA